MLKGTAIFLLSLSSAAYAVTPSYVTIPPVVNGQPNPSYDGTGCPAGSARAVVSPDLQSFTLIFDKFFVNASTANMSDKKYCKILVMFDFPEGWSYSLFRMDYRGFYDLTAQGTANQSATYFFKGHVQQARLDTEFKGGTWGNYLFSNSLPINAVVWSPCKEKRSGLTIMASLSAKVKKRDPSEHAYLTVDSADGHTQTSYALQWQRCGALGTDEYSFESSEYE